MSDHGRATPQPAWPAGWYPDPLRRFSYRYFNGQRWTADVADGGTRYVDPSGAPEAADPRRQGPPPIAPPARARTRAAIASMVLAISGVVVGWVPVVFAAGAVCAIAAVILGIVGLQAAGRNGGAGRGFAIAGLAVAPLALAASGAGLALTMALFDRIDLYLDEGPHEVAVTACTVDPDGVADVEGTLRNLSDDRRDYVVRLRLVRRGTDNVLAGRDVKVDDVSGGTTATWGTRLAVGQVDAACVVAEVTGPFPYGVDPG